jgi:hypothetical protein
MKTEWRRAKWGAKLNMGGAISLVVVGEGAAQKMAILAPEDVYLEL